MVLQMQPDYQGTIGVLTPVLDNSYAAAVAVVPATIALTSGGAYPSDAIGTPANPIAGTSGSVANAVASVTLAGVAARTTYITGFQITGSGATAAGTVTATVTGLKGGTQSYLVGVVAGNTAANPALAVTFVPALPASAVNTAIVVSCPALGVGNLVNIVNASGYQL